MQASDIKGAWDNLQESLKGTISDYAVTSITETLILDVYPYVGTEKSTVSSEVEQEKLVEPIYDIKTNFE